MFQLVRVVSNDLKVRRGNGQVNSVTMSNNAQHKIAVGAVEGLTEPIERKKPNVAALLSMY